MKESVKIVIINLLFWLITLFILLVAESDPGLGDFALLIIAAAAAVSMTPFSRKKIAESTLSTETKQLFNWVVIAPPTFFVLWFITSIFINWN